MAEIRFYHLTARSVDQALPDILQKALSAGHRIVVRTGDETETERLAAHLWAFRPESFIPHGSTKDGRGTEQPVWLTSGDDIPNGANVMVVTTDVPLESGQEIAEGITLLCDLFDGRDETALQAARRRWAAYKNGGHAMTYWQQTETGWQQK
jgi:DNA polymerase-3 subunit chi